MKENKWNEEKKSAESGKKNGKIRWALLLDGLLCGSDFTLLSESS